MWSRIWHYTQRVGCRERRIHVAVLATSAFDTTKIKFNLMGPSSPPLIKVRAVLFLYFKNQRPVLHFQVTRYMYKKQTMFIISYYSRLCTTTTAVSTQQVFKEQISAIEVGRAKRGCACFCTLASESTSVLIYVLIKVQTVLF